MTRSETAQIITIMQLNYPDTFRGMSDQAISGMVDLWQRMFTEEPAALVQNAVEAHICASTDRYMPNIGIIKEEIRKLTQPQGMSENEAWSLVMAALRNSAYGYREEYAKLPPAVRRAVGNENTLREWAMLPTEELNTVVASNFMRSFRAIQKREEEWAKLPQAYRDEMQRLSGQIFGQLEAGNETDGGGH